MRTKGIVIVPPSGGSCARRLDSTDVPSLLKVGNRPIVCHVLDSLLDAGVAEIAVLAPSGLREEIAAAIEGDAPSPAQLSYLDGAATPDPAQRICTVARFAAGSQTIVHSSDGVLAQPLRPLLGLLSRERSDAVLLLAEGIRSAERIEPATMHALGVAELHPARAALGVAGVCMLAPGVLDGLCEAPPGRLSFERIAASLSAREDAAVQVRVVRRWHRFAGDPLDLLDINRVVLDRLQQPAPVHQSDGNRLEGHVSIDPSASVSSSVICGPAIIGAGAMIADSYVGPHTSIGERVSLEGAEIEQSIVFADASVMHVGGRLVTSVIGRGARIFRDFSVPRAMRMQVGDGDEVALC